MRLALIATALAALSACGGEPGADGPERSSAAGEVLGGEVTDDMLPIDTVQSTSPADPRAGATGVTGASDVPDAPDTAATPVDRNPGPLPSPQVSGGPGGRQSAGLEPTPEPPTE